MLRLKQGVVKDRTLTVDGAMSVIATTTLNQPTIGECLDKQT